MSEFSIRTRREVRYFHPEIRGSMGQSLSFIFLNMSPGLKDDLAQSLLNASTCQPSKTSGRMVSNGRQQTPSFLFAPEPVARMQQL